MALGKVSLGTSWETNAKNEGDENPLPIPLRKIAEYIAMTLFEENKLTESVEIIRSNIEQNVIRNTDDKTIFFLSLVSVI